MKKVILAVLLVAAIGASFILGACSNSTEEVFTQEDVETVETVKETAVVNYPATEMIDNHADEEVIAEEEIEEIQEPSIEYAIIWTMKPMPVYSNLETWAKVGSTSLDESYTVISEESNYFLIKFGDGYGYVDSNYCLINLSDYLGNMLKYNITNSYDSIYMIHGNKIPNITGTVVTGYEDVEVSDSEYLVPLLYPTAKKLAEVAAKVNADGFRLKIYDAFRPYVTTRYIYDTTSSILYSKIPDSQETYYFAMTNNAYGLGSFLASGSSYHNFGVAMDLTIEDSEGNELEMQSAMHDLSYHSVIANNNESANLLAKYMTEGGFVGISSEWWHFQDAESINRYGTLRNDGVKINGWVFLDGVWQSNN